MRHGPTGRLADAEAAKQPLVAVSAAVGKGAGVPTAFVLFRQGRGRRRRRRRRRRRKGRGRHGSSGARHGPVPGVAGALARREGARHRRRAHDAGRLHGTVRADHARRRWFHARLVRVAGADAAFVHRRRAWVWRSAAQPAHDVVGEVIAAETAAAARWRRRRRHLGR